MEQGALDLIECNGRLALNVCSVGFDARIGLGAGCVIKNFVEDELQSGVFVEIPMDPPIPRRTIGFVSNSQSFHSKALDMFIKFYRHFYGKAF